MKRREFILGLGSAAACPLVAAAQPQQRRRVGMLLPATADDRAYQTWIAAFLENLALFGWTDSINLQVETRWAGAATADVRRHAAELVALRPTPFWRMGPRRSAHCCEKRLACRLYS
jgi:putative ABC transport system substrate-binding protein